MKKYIPIALAFLAGATAGATGAYFYLKNRYLLIDDPDAENEMDILEKGYKKGVTPDEWNEVGFEKLHDQAMAAIGKYSGKDYIKPTTDALNRLREKPSMDEIMAKMSMEGATDEEMDDERAELEAEELLQDGLKDEGDTMPFELKKDPENPRDPFWVPEDVFICDYPEEDHDFLTYYSLDNILCDDQGKKVDISVIGEENLAHFDDNDMLFIVNEKLGLVIEVEYIKSSYTEDVLGIYPDDDDEYESMPKKKRFADEGED